VGRYALAFAHESLTFHVRLDQLLGDVEVLQLRGDPDPAGTDIVAITATSQTVLPGSLFCCVQGRTTDGHRFAPAAVAAGAVALLCERPLDTAVLGREVPQAVVADGRAAMARAAAALHNHPSRRVAVVGVTGTNGKTTTTHLLKAILEADGRGTEVIGTLSGPRTTPEATELQAALDGAADRGMAAVALEVSSHALALHRVDGIWFSVAVFTNLSPEHLDFHGGMDDYFAAKAGLFSPERAGVAVVNADDPWGRRLLAAARLPTRTFSLADAVGLDLGPDGARFRWDGRPVWLRSGGTFNVANALAAATAARELDVPAAAVADGLSSAGAVPGRLETVDRGQPFRVLVDYAHTPAGLEACLRAARQMVGRAAGAAMPAGTPGAGSGSGSGSGPGPGAGAAGRVLVVFGCGGDRDHAKRPLMGGIASRLADMAVLTSDNPRSEDPAAIAAAVLSGVDHQGVVVVEPDRRAAIGLALSSARPGDVVVLAGKGHETTQVTGDRVVAFDDRVVAAEELARIGSGRLDSGRLGSGRLGSGRLDSGSPGPGAGGER
ncbi:MAG TPA: UDP-N-acetylmuramoyl-L-alanyl-D-glutamate--2,6-diaminopimelate ligase, partial [Acidimicrobiales bacterium]|nr:UDP-N-acetylmuramoyl-L-alanyl-D-glutamate--2,6-diaminopimelate ligase [Acidimicrobiales bacterium]